MRSYAVDHHVSPSSGQLDPKSGNSNGEDQKPQNKKKKNKKKKKKITNLALFVKTTDGNSII